MIIIPNKIKRKIILINLLILFSVISINSKDTSKNIYPSKPKLLQGYTTFEDEEGGTTLQLDDIKTSKHIIDNSGIDYSIKSALGGSWEKAWCISGDGIGDWFRCNISPNQFLQKGKMNVYRITILNGLAANKNLYFANNRVKKIEAEFSEGEKIILNLYDGVLDLQIFKINIKSLWIKLTIREIYKGNKFNDTCIGKIYFETAEHPDDEKK